MALSVTSNFAISAGYAANNMRSSQSLMGKSINRISSGHRAPNPADNITAYVGGNKIKADAKGYEMLETGVQDVGARLNMIDSVLSDVENALLELKSQRVAYSAATDGDEKSALNSAAAQTINAIKTAMKTAQYKGNDAFSSSALSIYYDPTATTGLTVGTIAVKYNTAIAAMASNIGSINLTAIKGYLSAIGNQRAALGGNISALEQISNYLSDVATSAEAGYTAITEVDMAKEMTSYVKNNIQSQAAQAMVAQANQGLAQVLNLLQV